MLRYGLMLVLCVAVVATMGGVLVWFFRRLARIEEERWGKRVGFGRPDIVTRFFARREARRAAGTPGEPKPEG
jgi:hypothetical protein